MDGSLLWGRVIRFTGKVRWRELTATFRAFTMHDFSKPVKVWITSRKPRMDGGSRGGGGGGRGGAALWCVGLRCDEVCSVSTKLRRKKSKCSFSRGREVEVAGDDELMSCLTTTAAKEDETLSSMKYKCCFVKVSRLQNTLFVNCNFRKLGCADIGGMFIFHVDCRAYHTGSLFLGWTGVWRTSPCSVPRKLFVLTNHWKVPGIHLLKQKVSKLINVLKQCPVWSVRGGAVR